MTDAREHLNDLADMAEEQTASLDKAIRLLALGDREGCMALLLVLRRKEARAASVTLVDLAAQIERAKALASEDRPLGRFINLGSRVKLRAINSAEPGEASNPPRAEVEPGSAGGSL